MKYSPNHDYYCAHFGRAFLDYGKHKNGSGEGVASGRHAVLRPV